MKRLVVGLLMPLAGCSLISASRTPLWSIKPENLILILAQGQQPLAIPDKHLIVCTTQARHLVAYDVNTGTARWSSNVNVQRINGFDGSTITVQDQTGGISLVEAATGKTLQQVDGDKVGDVVPVVLNGVMYGVQGSRVLTAATGNKTLWNDRLGFIPNYDSLPEIDRGLLVFKGGAEHVVLGFFRVYAPDTGALIWETEAEGDVVKKTPLTAQVSADRAVILREGILTSRELSTGKVVWSETSDQDPVVTTARVLAFDKETVKVLDAVNGKPIAKWNKTVGIGSNIATVADGVVYTARLKPVQTLAGTQYNFSLVALEEKSGKVLWESTVDKRTWFAAPIVMDDKVIVVAPEHIFAMKR